jgi:hypothetical protein
MLHEYKSIIYPLRLADIKVLADDENIPLAPLLDDDGMRYVSREMWLYLTYGSMESWTLKHHCAKEHWINWRPNMFGWTRYASTKKTIPRKAVRF